MIFILVNFQLFWQQVTAIYLVQLHFPIKSAADGSDAMHVCSTFDKQSRRSQLKYLHCLYDEIVVVM